MRGGVAGAVLAVATLCCAAGRAEEALRPYTIVGEAIPVSLTGAKGDPDRGKAIVLNRQVGLCLLCHSGPFPEERFQGNMAPDLKGTGPVRVGRKASFGCAWSTPAGSTRTPSCRPTTWSTA